MWLICCSEPYLIDSNLLLEFVSTMSSSPVSARSVPCRGVTVWDVSLSPLIRVLLYYIARGRGKADLFSLPITQIE